MEGNATAWRQRLARAQKLSMDALTTLREHRTCSPRARIDISDLDYWGYLMLWRDHICSREAPSFLAPLRRHRHMAYADRDRLQKVRGQLGERLKEFPLEQVALKHSLNENELTILAALTVAELPLEHERRGPLMFRDDRSETTGHSLISLICRSEMDLAKYASILSRQSKLVSDGLVRCLDDSRSLFEANFSLAGEARRVLLAGLPEIVIRQDSENTLCRVIEPRLKLEDVVLPPKTRERIDEVLICAREQKTLLDDWGFGKVLHYGRGTGVLFYGPPGTGKTRAAQALGGELGKSVWVVDFSRLMNMYLGETEKLIVKLFKDAQEAQAMLLIDEADGLFATRDMAVHGWEIRHTNVLLQEIERYEGVFILTTNNKPALDRALERRLTAIIEFPLPGKAEREAIWKMHLPSQAPTSGEINFAALAEFELTGGEIKKAVLSAATAALKRTGRNRAIAQEDLETAAKSLVKAVGRVGFRAQGGAL